MNSHKDVLADLREGTPRPVYLLHGEEPYFTDLLTRAFEEGVVDEASRSFNQQVLYGRDTDAGQIVDAASRFPMMAPRQLVLVKEAQDLSSIGQLAGYLQQPVPSTVLVLAFRGKKLKASTKVYKAIAHAGTVFESKPLYANRVPAFIAGELKQRRRRADAGVGELLAEYLGTDLVALGGALDKLVLNVPAGETITPSHIETHVGISRQFNVFELQDALGEKDLTRVVRIGYALAQNERDNPLPMLLASLYGFFAAMYAVYDVIDASDVDQKAATGVYSAFRLGKIRQAARRWSPSQLSGALELLAEYDLKGKGVEYAGGGGGDLILEFTERLVGVAVASRRTTKPQH